MHGQGERARENIYQRYWWSFINSSFVLTSASNVLVRMVLSMWNKDIESNFNNLRAIGENQPAFLFTFVAGNKRLTHVIETCSSARVLTQLFYLIYLKYRYTPSTWPPSCKSRHVQHIPILGVTPDYQYRGRQHVEGKLCDKWQSVIHYGGRNPPRGSAPGTITKTWFVFFNTGVRPPRHEPVKYVYYNSGTQSTKTSIRKEVMWRGYHPNVPNHYHILPKECHGK